MNVTVKPHVEEAWKVMADEVGLDVSSFVRACVRLAGPRLAEVYVTNQTRELRRLAVIDAARRRLLEVEP